MSVNRADPLPPIHEVLASIPVPISEALQQALAINSNDRFATVDELWLIVKSVADEIAARESVNAMMPLPQVPEGNRDKIIPNEGIVLMAEQVADTPAPLLDIPADFIASMSRTTEAAISQVPVDRPILEASVPAQLTVRSVTRRSFTARYVLITVVFLALLAGGSTAVWLNSRPSTSAGGQGTAQIHSTAASTVTMPKQTSTPTVTIPKQTSTPTVTMPKQTSMPTVASKLTPTVAATPVPKSTSAPTSVPDIGSSDLATTYSGNAHNTPASVDASMTLSQVKQNGTAISGYIAFGSGLLGDGNFTGTVTGNTMQFFVPAGMYSTILPLSFQGQLNLDGSLSGTYCSSQNNQCASGAGYGTWNVSPASSGYLQSPTREPNSFDPSVLFLRKQSFVDQMV
jgi:hypothetical protein